MYADAEAGDLYGDDGDEELDDVQQPVIPPPAPPPATPPTVPAKQPNTPLVDTLDGEEDFDSKIEKLTKEVFLSGDEPLPDVYAKDDQGSKTKYTKKMFRLIKLIEQPLGRRMLKNSLRVNMRYCLLYTSPSPRDS